MVVELRVSSLLNVCRGRREREREGEREGGGGRREEEGGRGREREGGEGGGRGRREKEKERDMNKSSKVRGFTHTSVFPRFLLMMVASCSIMESLTSSAPFASDTSKGTTTQMMQTHYMHGCILTT